jgi:hypothetical protein
MTERASSQGAPALTAASSVLLLPLSALLLDQDCRSFQKEGHR